MIEDSMMQEVRKAKEAYARRHDFDLQRIVDDLRELDSAGDWPVVSFLEKPIDRASADRRECHTTAER
jgi:hypothetical protein